MSLKSKIIALRKEGKTYPEIEKELQCTRGTISYYCRSEGLTLSQGANKSPSKEDIKEMNTLRKRGRTIKEVAKELNWSTGTIAKYSNKTGDRRKPYSNSENVQRWRRRTKRRLVEYKGGKCSICEYDKCMAALEFHHIDPKEKKFTLGSGTIRAWETLKKEADKCILLCSNCHKEVEYDKTII